MQGLLAVRYAGAACVLQFFFFHFILPLGLALVKLVEDHLICITPVLLHLAPVMTLITERHDMVGALQCVADRAHAGYAWPTDQMSDMSDMSDTQAMRKC